MSHDSEKFLQDMLDSIRFRHVLVHGYDVVDPDITWAILQEKLPVLRNEVEGLLPLDGPS